MEAPYVNRWTGTVRSFTKEIFDHVQKSEALLLEGSSSVPELAYLMDLVVRFDVHRVIEIGFNIGFSSHAFLTAREDVTVVSFDRPGSLAVSVAKEFIDKKFPGRHQLILGDSRETLPNFLSNTALAAAFQLAFVDGGHEYDISSSDLRNCHTACPPGAIVVMDDLTPWVPWGIGPTKAWLEAVETGIVEPLEIHRDGIVTERIEGPADRVWGMGRFA
ncbi:class I SAM-dependent methyltransferase [Streptomyces sp. NPDC001401]|uniref:class I SAM-dependent methyltransferase n=1 Tax=Streptomyces sp. NPDC001401 TaxID=3364570 RepID=UPI003679A123